MFYINDIPIIFNNEEVFNYLHDAIIKNDKGYICTINANLLSEAFHNKNFLPIIQNSVFNICDGSIIAKIASYKYKEKLKPFPGPDFFISVIKQKKYKNFFLGSNDDILRDLKQNLIKIDKNIEKSVFMSLPYYEVINDFNFNKISKKINEAKPDIIWLSLGAPKQEIFASVLQDYLDKGVIINVGAAFGFYSGIKKYKRAPLLVRKLSLEWFWRFLHFEKNTTKRLVREIFTLPLIIFNECRK